MRTGLAGRSADNLDFFPRQLQRVDVFSITAFFLALERLGPVEETQPCSRLYLNLRWILVCGAMTALIMTLGFDCMT